MPKINVKTIFTSVFVAGISYLLLWAGFSLTQAAYNQISDYQQALNIQVVDIAATLPGQVLLHGAISGETITGPVSGKQCYAYKLIDEVMARNSDDESYWKVFDSQVRAAPFYLQDATSRLPVTITNTGSRERQYVPSNIYFGDAGKETSLEDGKYRKTEYCLTGDRQIYLKGNVHFNSGKFFIEPEYIGIYTAEKAALDEHVFQSWSAFKAVWLLWAGVSIIGLALLGVCYILSYYRIMAYISMLAMVTFVLLLHYSLSNVEQDAKRALHDFKQKRLALENYATSAAISNNDKSTLQVDAKRINLVSAYLRLESYFSLPTNYLLLALQDIEPPAFQYTEYEKNKAISQQEDLPRMKLHPFFVVFFVLSGFGWGGFWVYLAMKKLNRRRLIENVQSIKTAGLACGIAELQGKIKVLREKILLTPVESKLCVWYRCRVYQNVGGENDEALIEDKQASVDFVLRDSEGEVVVFPKNADVHTRHIIQHHADGRRYLLQWIDAEDDIYAFGPVSIHPRSTGKLCLKSSDKTKEYLISNYSEKELMLKTGYIGLLCLCLAFSALVLIVISIMGYLGRFSSLDFFVSAMISPLLVLGLAFVFHFNDLVFLRSRAQRNSSNIEVSLRKRKNLIPYLEKILKRYIAHEKYVYKKLVKLRAEWQNLQAQKNVSQNLDDLKQEVQGLVEDYPELKSLPIVQNIIKNVIQMENEVAASVSGYNDAVELYNRRCSSIPDIVLAKLFGFKKLPLLS